MKAIAFFPTLKRLTSLLIPAFLLCTPAAMGQMDRTQMLEQIAKLQLYISQAEKGYQLVHQGLTTIGKIKQGDFDLHQLFFTSLQLVNPEVRSYIKIADMITMQVDMLSVYKQYYQHATASHLFSSSELAYIYSFYKGILDKTTDDIGELTGILTDGHWQMDDAQRLGRIDLLYTSVTDQYQSLQTFNSHVQLLAQQKSQTLQGLQNLSQLIQP